MVKDIQENSSSAQEKPRPRLLFIDNIRWVMIMLVLKLLFYHNSYRAEQSGGNKRGIPGKIIPGCETKPAG
jgi:hypothetical protein